jgi:hypothetical protein
MRPVRLGWSEDWKHVSPTIFRDIATHADSRGLLLVETLLPLSAATGQTALHRGGGILMAEDRRPTRGPPTGCLDRGDIRRPCRKFHYEQEEPWKTN